jgi:flagellar motor protein MotB
VSYADFITLLFAFFVVMYALSSVNEGKYRILSNSMVSAFRNVPVNSAGPDADGRADRRRRPYRSRESGEQGAGGSSRNSARRCATSPRTFLK